MTENKDKLILIVDDETHFRKSLRRILEDIGFRVVEAADGVEGIAVFEQEWPDMVITDLRMPSMNGMELVRILCDKHPPIPIIVISGVGNLDAAIKSIRQGAWDYISKPIRHSEEMMMIITRTFERAKLLTENKAYREHLEALVRVRTAELSQAYEDLKTTQEMMIQSEKMAMVGQMAAGIAHEIYNPISFVSSNLKTLDKYVNRLYEYIGNLEAKTTDKALLNEKKELRIDKFHEDLSQIFLDSHEGMDRLKKIISELKSFSRSETSDVKSVDLNELIDSAISLAWNEIKYKAVVEKKFGALKPVQCYTQQLHQVFVNFLINAVHAIDERGEITITTWREKNNACVSISDTGCGIPKEHYKRIFEPFFTTKQIGKGTGLGLSISYDTIRKHNGTVEFESEVGKGTTFTIKLPFKH